MATTDRLNVAIVGLWLGALVVSCSTASPGGDGIPATGLARTEALFARHCAVCHGEDGGGDGPAAPFLFPSPRDFGDGRFRLVSTENGAPTDADLVACLERGMPGAAMPSFAWLPGNDQLALARHVREIAIRRMASELQRKYAAAGQTLSSDEARDVAVWRLTPDTVVDVPPPVEPNEDLLARGRTLYLARCAACHGTEGEGQTPDRAWAEFEGIYWARDLRNGVLKGSASHAAIGARILAGMPGVAMPPVRLADPADTLALISYVRSLLPPDAEHRGVQRRQQLRAVRTGTLPEIADDALWQAAPPIRVELMALACRQACIRNAELRALHDGRGIAVLVSWDDATRDDRAIGGVSRWADQCALQLSAEESPPLFGMGGHDQPVNIWHWAAFRARDVVGALDLIGSDRADAPPAHAPGLVEPANRADDVAARGFDERPRVDEAAITAAPTYRDGRWHVVFRRELDPRAARPFAGVLLRAGWSVQLSAAVWNGSAEDRGALKSVSTWHELTLDP